MCIDGSRWCRPASRRACPKPNASLCMPRPDPQLQEKIEAIATKVYGAASVEFSPEVGLLYGIQP